MKRVLKTGGLLLALALFAAGCKTGKGCDCPTFGQTKTPQEKHF